MFNQVSPAVHTSKKSVYTPGAESDAIGRAIQAARGVDRVMPVFHGDHMVALVRGSAWWEREPSAVYWTPMRCAITSYNDIIAAISAGQQFRSYWSKAQGAVITNNWYDLWPVGGHPVAGTYAGAAKTAVRFDDTTTGSIQHGGNVSTAIKRLTGLFVHTSASTPTLMLYDRVLAYEACNFSNPVGTAQTMTNTLTALRYAANGEAGLKIMTFCQTNLGATATTFSALAYTDQAGNTNQAMPLAYAPNIIVSAAAPTTSLGARIVAPAVAAITVVTSPFMPLLAGDSGVQLIAGYTTTGGGVNTGTFGFALVQPLAWVPITLSTTGVLMDTVMQNAALPRIFDGACLAWGGYFPASSAVTSYGSFESVWS